jgi:predicted outer membrane repeat protein
LQLENTIVTLTECRFEKNAARGDGGAADFDDSTIASVSSALFSANQAGRNGGAIAITNRSSLESAGVTFQGNQAKHSGNGIRMRTRPVSGVAATFRQRRSHFFGVAASLRLTSGCRGWSFSDKIRQRGRFQVSVDLLQDRFVIEIDSFRDQLPGVLSLAEQKKAGEVKLDLPARSRDAAPITLVSSGDGHLAYGTSRRIEFSPDVDFEIRECGLRRLIEVPNADESGKMRVQGNDIVKSGVLVLNEGAVYSRPIMGVFFADVLFHRGPLRTNHLFHKPSRLSE